MIDFDILTDESEASYYSEPLIYRLSTASNMCRGCADRLRLAGQYCATEQWTDAINQTRLAVDLRTTILEMIELPEWKKYIQKVPNLPRSVFEPLIDIADKRRNGQEIDPVDVRLRGGDGDEWDIYLRGLAGSMEVLGDLLEEEGKR